MMDYLLKFLLCSTVLYAFYYLVLRNDRAFRFNRFFLLSILIIALVVPATIIKTSIVEIPLQESVTSATETVTQSPLPTEAQASSRIPDLQSMLPNLYLVVSGLLLLRLLIHLIAITRFRLGGKTVFSDDLKIVLRPDIDHPFSFLGFVFTNQQAFESGDIPGEIIQHEKAHVHQKHSYDILFMELMTCLFWFNPVVFLIKRAVKLNHEFLADESVIAQTGSTGQYQRIIIQAASQQMILNPSLTSHLNYGETKKRLKIMARQNRKGISLLKQTGAIMIITALFLWLGAERVIAQQATGLQETQNQSTDNAQVAQDRPPPPPPVLVRLNPYAKVRFKNEVNETVTGIFDELTNAQKQRFLAGNHQSEIMIPPPPRAHLTQAMLTDFQNEKKYGLWIDGERKDNAELKNYQLSDFHHFFKTRLTKRAKNYGKYEFHLNMVTMKNMEQFLKERWIPFKEEFIPTPDEKVENGPVVVKKRKN